MVVWFLKWRQMLWITLLVAQLWSGGLMCSTGDGEERLAVWWQAEQERSGHGYLQLSLRKTGVTIPAWLEQGGKWATVGVWVGVSLTAVWQLRAGEIAPLMAGVILTIATHQVRSKVEHLRKQRYQEEEIVVWQNLAEEGLNGAIAQARLASAEEKESIGGSKRELSEKTRSQNVKSPLLEMGQSLAQLVEDLPIGTNQGMLHFLWALVSGNLLESRGAIFPALQKMGLDEAESRRAWAAFAKGKWKISQLLTQWQRQVEAEGVWEEHRFEEYRVKAVDLVGFWRPKLQNCLSKHYKAEAGKALPAVVLGMVTRVGQMGGQRIPLPTDFIRVDPDDPSEATLTSKLLKRVAASLADDEVAVLDAGFSLKELLDVEMKRFLLRLATNATARRNSPPPYKGHGRPPEWGDIVRPLARTYNGKTTAATPADRQVEWQIKDKKGHQLTIKAQFWDDLLHSEQKPDPQAQTFNIVAIHDPRYKKPLLLATPLSLKGETLQELYLDRWPVEQLPLSAKQMIGAVRQFVHAPESIQRLPEISLLAGAILTYVAAKLPPIPTGFWDRAPKATPGRLRRVLTGQPLSPDLPLSARIRKKNSLIAHLLKGILAHRRQKRVK
jgi:hypothetical protein